MKVKQISTTNKMFTKHNGSEMIMIRGDDVINLFASVPHMSDVYCIYHTSYVKLVQINDNVITIETRNSTYKYSFEDLVEAKSFLLMNMEKNEIDELEDKITTAEKFYGFI